MSGVLGTKRYCHPVVYHRKSCPIDTASLPLPMIDEGVVFRIGSLMLDGIEPTPGAGARLLESWKTYRGQIYSEHLIDSFVQQNAASLPPHASAGNILEMYPDGNLRLLNFRLELPN